MWGYQARTGGNLDARRTAPDRHHGYRQGAAGTRWTTRRNGKRWGLGREKLLGSASFLRAERRPPQQEATASKVSRTCHTRGRSNASRTVSHAWSSCSTSANSTRGTWSLVQAALSS